MNVLVMYNPNSTGDSEANARSFAKELRNQAGNELSVRIKQTTHAGHLEEIAREQAASGREIILISSSGDGGYHELVNGALSDPKSKVITGLLPSGNANDHHSYVSDGDIITRIINRDFMRLDTLKITGRVHDRPWTRYAHSYAGIGVSAVAADDMTKQRPNAVSEKWLLLKSLLSFSSVKIRTEEHEHAHRYSSIIFANIPVMSKALKLSEHGQPDDGKFEVSRIRLVSKPLLIFTLLKAATIGLKTRHSVSRYSFKTTRAIAMQLDGEVMTLDGNCDVIVEAVHQNLRCVV